MKILAFDIGSHAVKAVELDVTFGRVELSDYLIERVVESHLQEVQAKTQAAEAEKKEGEEKKEEENAAPPRQILSAGQIAAIKRVLGERQFKFDRLVINLPKAWVTTRIFNFPTKDKKAIQSSLNFELDDDIPFPIEDVIYDFAILNQEGNNSTLFTGVALKSDITQLLSELQMLGLDPDCITVESWGISQLLKRATPKEYENRPVCVVNIGARQSTIHMFVGDGPVLSHVSQCAGQDITLAIAQSYNLSFDQAEKSKIDGAFLLTQTHMNNQLGETITPEQKQFATTISDAFIPLVRDIKQTLMAFKSQYKLTPRAIFITGGSSQIPNLPLYLEENLRLPVFTFAYMSKIVGQTLQLSESTESLISSATSYALSVVKTDRFSNINFRKDLFAKKSGLGAIDFKAIQRPLKYVAASLVFVYVNLIVQGLILSSRGEKQNELLERSIKGVLGAVSPSAMSTYKSSPNTLKSTVTKEIAKYKDVKVAPPKPQVSAFDLLNKLSSSMPRDMTLDVSLFQVKDGKFKLTGVVDQLAASMKIQKAIEETKLFTDVTKDKTEEDPKTKKVKFEFSAKVAEAGHVKN